MDSVSLRINEFKVKGSLFKAYTYEANHITDIKEKISQLENRFSDASHICYAYRICNADNLDLFYNPEIIEFSTDAGEPSGTAGKPILNTLKKNKIINRVIFVVRYFGGTKLGIPGLIKSYKHASESVLKNVEYKKWVLLKELSLKLNYEYHKMIDKISTTLDYSVSEGLSIYHQFGLRLLTKFNLLDGLNLILDFNKRFKVIETNDLESEQKYSNSIFKANLSYKF